MDLCALPTTCLLLLLKKLRERDRVSLLAASLSTYHALTSVWPVARASWGQQQRPVPDEALAPGVECLLLPDDGPAAALCGAAALASLQQLVVNYRQAPLLRSLSAGPLATTLASLVVTARVLLDGHDQELHALLQAAQGLPRLRELTLALPAHGAAAEALGRLSQVRALQLYAHDFGAAGRSAEGGAFGQAAGGGKGLQHVSLANGTLCEARRAISGGDLCAAVSDLQRLTRLALALPLWLSAQQPLLALQQLTALRSCDLTLLPLLQHEMTSSLWPAPGTANSGAWAGPAAAAVLLQEQLPIIARGWQQLTSLAIDARMPAAEGAGWGVVLDPQEAPPPSLDCLAAAAQLRGLRKLRVCIAGWALGLQHLSPLTACRDLTELALSELAMTYRADVASMDAAGTELSSAEQAALAAARQAAGVHVCRRMCGQPACTGGSGSDLVLVDVGAPGVKLPVPLLPQLRALEVDTLHWRLPLAVLSVSLEDATYKRLRHSAHYGAYVLHDASAAPGGTATDTLVQFLTDMPPHEALEFLDGVMTLLLLVQAARAAVAAAVDALTAAPLAQLQQLPPALSAGALWARLAACVACVRDNWRLVGELDIASDAVLCELHEELRTHLMLPAPDAPAPVAAWLAHDAAAAQGSPVLGDGGPQHADAAAQQQAWQAGVVALLQLLQAVLAELMVWEAGLHLRHSLLATVAELQRTRAFLASMAPEAASEQSDAERERLALVQEVYAQRAAAEDWVPRAVAAGAGPTGSLCAGNVPVGADITCLLYADAAAARVPSFLAAGVIAAAHMRRAAATAVVAALARGSTARAAIAAAAAHEADVLTLALQEQVAADDLRAGCAGIGCAVTGASAALLGGQGTAAAAAAGAAAGAGCAAAAATLAVFAEDLWCLAMPPARSAAVAGPSGGRQRPLRGGRQQPLRGGHQRLLRGGHQRPPRARELQPPPLAAAYADVLRCQVELTRLDIDVTGVCKAAHLGSAQLMGLRELRIHMLGEVRLPRGGLPLLPLLTRLEFYLPGERNWEANYNDEEDIPLWKHQTYVRHLVVRGTHHAGGFFGRGTLAKAASALPYLKRLTFHGCSDLAPQHVQQVVDARLVSDVIDVIDGVNVDTSAFVQELVQLVGPATPCSRARAPPPGLPVGHAEAMGAVMEALAAAEAAAAAAAAEQQQQQQQQVAVGGDGAVAAAAAAAAAAAGGGVGAGVAAQQQQQEQQEHEEHEEQEEPQDASEDEQDRGRELQLPRRLHNWQRSAAATAQSAAARLARFRAVADAAAGVGVTVNLSPAADWRRWRHTC